MDKDVADEQEGPDHHAHIGKIEDREVDDLDMDIVDDIAAVDPVDEVAHRR